MRESRRATRRRVAVARTSAGAGPSKFLTSGCASSTDRFTPSSGNWSKTSLHDMLQGSVTVGTGSVEPPCVFFFLCWVSIVRRVRVRGQAAVRGRPPGSPHVASSRLACVRVCMQGAGRVPARVWTEQPRRWHRRPHGRKFPVSLSLTSAAARPASAHSATAASSARAAMAARAGWERGGLAAPLSSLGKEWERAGPGARVSPPRLQDRERRRV
jgi:hypothetical protein